MKPPAARKLEELASAISRRWGLDPRLIGEQSLLGALRRQMLLAGAVDGNAYVAELLEDAGRVELLVDELLVPETWFFRDRQPFHCLRQFALQRLRSSPADRLRVLSIPCSTGEEPYSIAMALLDAGLSARQFQVDAADVSQRHLSLASQAVFGKASFRGDERDFPGACERYLERRGESSTVSAEVRRTVEFFQANLVAPLMLSERPPYHVIFCRNVLIYLTPAARQAALENLHRWLLAGGLLYCGHVEARLVRSGPFVPFAREFPFAFAPVTRPHSRPSADAESSARGTSPAAARRRRPASIAPPAADSGPAVADAEPVAAMVPTGCTPAPGAAATRGEVASGEVASGEVASGEVASGDRAGVRASTDSELAAARQAADAGQVEQAQALCLRILSRQPGQAEAIYLLGLTSLASGRPDDAEARFRQVLYLDPRHEDALVHMMLLAEQRGDPRSAANYRRRVQRLSRSEGEQ